MKFSLGNLGGTIMMGDSEIVRFKYRKDELQFNDISSVQQQEKNTSKKKTLER